MEACHERFEASFGKWANKREQGIGPYEPVICFDAECLSDVYQGKSFKKS